MSVDKFGLVKTSENVSIQPIRKFLKRMDDLVDIEGFNEPGSLDNKYCLKLGDDEKYRRSMIKLNDLPNVKGFNNGEEDKIYGFKLKDGVYNREEISIPSKSSDDVDLVSLIEDFEEIPVSLIKENEILKFIPTKYDWELDFQLRNDKVVFTKDGGIKKINNSGSLIQSLFSLALVRNNDDDDPVILKKYNNEYYISLNQNESLGSISLGGKFDDEKYVISDFPLGSTFIIDGIILETFNNFVRIMDGVPITCSNADYVNKEFRLIIRKYKNGGLDIGGFGIQAGKVGEINLFPIYIRKQEINLSHIYIRKQYMINRIRFTNRLVTDDIINYL